jgi:hypothetical protein
VDEVENGIVSGWVMALSGVSQLKSSRHFLELSEINFKLLLV